MSSRNIASQVVALSVVLVLALTACGNVSTAAIADQADTSASIASEDLGSTNFDVAIDTFTASFAASVADYASGTLANSFEGMAEGISADVDVYGDAFSSADVAAQEAGNLAASVEGAADEAYQVAYAETFAEAYAQAYADQYGDAASVAAKAVVEDFASSMNADIEAIESGLASNSVEDIEGGTLANDFMNAYDEANAAASAQVDPGGQAAGSSGPADNGNLTLGVALVLILVVGGGVWLMRANKQNA
jgi:hypothetical protein